MEIKFEVKMTQKAMFNFLMHHAYSGASGFVGTILGVAALVLTAFTFGKVEMWQTTLYLVFGIWFLLYLPVSLYFRSVKQVKLNPVFKKPITYILGEEGIRTVQGDQHADAAWTDLYKVRETKVSLLIYTGKRYCFVWPRESMGDQYSNVVTMVREHTAAEKVKLHDH
ncbi:MAG: YcxB family protein [Candidatus Choladocola sp.]|nr:YcxB family protein [Candidatus Choladocola sp.]